MGCEWGHGSGHTLQVKRTRNPSDIERSSPGRVLSWPSSPAPSVGSASAASPDKCPIPIHSERHSPVSLREKPGMRMNLLPRQGVSSEIIHPDSYPPPTNVYSSRVHLVNMTLEAQHSAAIGIRVFFSLRPLRRSGMAKRPPRRNLWP